MLIPPAPLGSPGRPADPPETAAARAGRIVDAAYALLDEQGLDGITVRAVLDRTGLSRRAFYECFDGKDTLMLAVFATTIGRAADGLRSRFAALAGPLQRLELFVRTIAGGGEDEADGRHDRRATALSREHMRLAEARPADLRMALAPLLELLAEQVAAGIADGAIRRTVPARTARLIYDLASAAAHTAFLAGTADAAALRDRRETAAAVWDFCRGALAC